VLGEGGRGVSIPNLGGVGGQIEEGYTTKGRKKGWVGEKNKRP